MREIAFSPRTSSEETGTPVILSLALEAPREARQAPSSSAPSSLRGECDRRVKSVGLAPAGEERP
eukprot:15044891-Alexandrium_andersonii.AAC.1